MEINNGSEVNNLNSQLTNNASNGFSFKSFDSTSISSVASTPVAQIVSFDMQLPPINPLLLITPQHSLWLPPANIVVLTTIITIKICFTSLNN